MKTYNQLDKPIQHFLNANLVWADKLWDEDIKLVRFPPDRQSKNLQAERYGVRESVWYVTGLLLRQDNDDLDRAYHTLDTILSYQLNSPGEVFHGTFLRYPDEPLPAADATIWRDYDPNWREFIATVLICLLIEFDSLLADELQNRMRGAIRLAAEGSFARHVDAEYSNIALMKVFLLDIAGQWFENASWHTEAEALADEIYALFKQHNIFTEYNSPTYYGIDLYALGLWREYSLSDKYRQYGAEIEAIFWRDIALFYNANIRNLCGPYDRSYGMDMTQYIATLGMWLTSILPATLVPLPDLSQEFEHAWDFFLMPLVAIIEPKLPEDVLPHFKAFQGERFLHRQLEAQRDVTAWLSDTIMIGAENDRTGIARNEQFHAATIHWITPRQTIGWIRLRSDTVVQATARPSGLNITSAEPLIYGFEVSLDDIKQVKIENRKWILPGLTVTLNNQNPVTVREVSEKRILIQYENMQSLNLHFTQSDVR